MSQIDSNSGRILSETELQFCQNLAAKFSKRYEQQDSAQLVEEWQPLFKMPNSESQKQTAQPAEISALEGQYSEQTVQSLMEELDFGDAAAMCELARRCLENSISDELVRQIAGNQTFKTKLNRLAKQYALGFAEPDSDHEAFMVLQRAEDHNDPDVLCALGRAYRFGWGVEKDVSKAVECYVKAANAGSYEAMERLGQCKRQNADEQLAAAFEHFQQLADAGNATAQFAVGCCYYYGVGVTENYKVAIQKLTCAANSGCSNAMQQLGRQYACEEGVSRDKLKAFELYKQAAAAGNSEAQNSLSWCYDSNIDNTKDDSLRDYWSAQAAMQGHSKTICEYGYGYNYGTRVEMDVSKAFQCFKQAAIAGYDSAQESAAECYYSGRGTARNFSKAAYWYQKVADAGSNSAAHHLGECRAYMLKYRSCAQLAFLADSGWQPALPSGFQAGNAAETAFLLLKLAAAGQCRNALELLGDCYFSGLGVRQDFNAAAMSYQRAISLGQTDSATLLKLICCHWRGETGFNELCVFELFKCVNATLRAETDSVLRQMQ